jgi:hypothetical protein
LKHTLEEGKIVSNLVRLRAGLGAALAFALSAAPVHADSPFASLAGTWSGSGQVRLDGGKTEAIRCKAYYTNKSGSNGLGLTLRCASASNKIDMYATLTYTNGDITGSWEERTFNATGSVAGHSTASKLVLNISGGITGQMQVSVGGSNQSVSITAEGAGTGFTGVNINLSRG